MFRLSLGLLLLALQLPVVAQSLSPEAQTQMVNQYNKWFAALGIKTEPNTRTRKIGPETKFSHPAQNRTRLLVKIDRQGNLNGVYLRESSPWPEADQDALLSVQESAPFPVFPNESLDEDISLHYNYVINVTGSQEEIQYRRKADKIRLEKNEQRSRLSILACLQNPSEQLQSATEIFIRYPDAETANDLLITMVRAQDWKLLGDTLPSMLDKFPIPEIKLTAMRAAYQQGKLNEAVQLMNQLEYLLEAPHGPEREGRLQELGGMYFSYRGYILYELGRKEEALAAWETGKKYAHARQREQFRLMGELVKQEGKVPPLWQEQWVDYGKRERKSCPTSSPTASILKGKLDQLLRETTRP